MKTIKDNLTIVHLDLSSNDLTARSGEVVFKVLENQYSIVSLDISSKQGINRNRLTHEGIKNLDNVLKNNKYLQILNISGNSIKIDGLKIIISGLNNNSTLHSLNIGNNNLDFKAMELFGNNYDITNFNNQFFNLTVNSDLRTKLVELDLSENPIGNEVILK